MIERSEGTTGPLRVVFMGTPEFAIPSLAATVDAGHDLRLVVTTPPRRAGRGRSVRRSPIDLFAEDRGLVVATPESLKDPVFLRQVVDCEPDIICVVAFRILPPELYEIPKLGSFNLHGSLLPRYRGAAPINRAIMAGDTTTGVTTFFLKRRVDTGGIILQRTMSIGPTMNAGELHDEMMVLGAAAVVDTLTLVGDGLTEGDPQDDSEATPAPKIGPADLSIDWRRPASEIANQVRGLSPRWGGLTMYGSERWKIFSFRQLDEPRELPPGELLTVGDHLFVGTGDGTLEIIELQREGNRRRDAAPLLRGFSGGLAGCFTDPDPE